MFNLSLKTLKKGQSSLEMAIAFVAVFILLLGSARIFVWLNQRMVTRQEAYEQTRIAAASNQPGRAVDESALPALDIFGEN